MKKLLSASALAGLAALAACGPKEPPKPAPPPPAPKIIHVPARPTPPNYSSRTLPVPELGGDGLFKSPNRDISPAQITWNLRSGYNVAALNCPSPDREEITTAYRAFLRKHARGLTAANRKVDAEFKAKYGASFIPQRERYMTEVYNHFALPPTLNDFCRAALAMSRDGATIKLTELDAFAARSLPSLEIVYDDFYRRYAQYKVDDAAWQTQWGSYTTAGGGTATK
ncbi:MAG: hypothetical protein KGL44_09285 [Sphingomonadales bacterium]|nr:hypothetical protein [Sphingomonadales bacterium]